MTSRTLLGVAALAVVLASCGGVTAHVESGVSGSGDAFGDGGVNLEVPGGAQALLVFEISDYNSFRVELVELNLNERGNTRRESLVWRFSSADLYQGTFLLDPVESARLDIHASDSSQWTVRIKSLTTAETVPDSGLVTGDSDTVLVDPSPPTSPFQLRFRSSGEDNFVVWGLANGRSSLLANELGSSEGVAVGVPANTAIYEITANGEWTLEIQE